MDNRVYIRFYEELNFFLDKNLRKTTIEREFKRGTTVKALIEDMGVPHTEVDLILINGNSQPFSYQLKPGDRISVYPVFETLDISEITRVREKPLRETKFILDVHLGKLTIYLRMLGFDATYSNHFDDDTLAILSVKEHRILLTRDTGLLKRRIITHGYYIHSKDPITQLQSVITHFNLKKSINPFSRCLRCNETLIDIPKSAVEKRVPTFVYNHYNIFKSCPKCGRVYWKGSHWNNMKKFLNLLDF